MVRWSSATERIQIVTIVPPSLASNLKIGNEESEMNETKRGKKVTEKEFTGTLIKSRFYSHIHLFTMLLQSIRFWVVKEKKKTEMFSADRSIKSIKKKNDQKTTWFLA